MHLAAHAARHLSSHQRSNRPACRSCGTGGTAERSITFDCCGSVFCVHCAAGMMTDLGNGNYRVACSQCGNRRISQLKTD